MTLHLDSQDVLEDAVRTLVTQDKRLAPILAATGMPALRRREPGFAGIVVCDVQLPGASGLQLLHTLREQDPELPVVLVTGQQVDRAVLARARGFAPLPMVTVALRAGQRGLSRHHAGTMPVVDMDRLEQLPTALRRAL